MSLENPFDQLNKIAAEAGVKKPPVKIEAPVIEKPIAETPEGPEMPATGTVESATPQGPEVSAEAPVEMPVAEKPEMPEQPTASIEKTEEEQQFEIAKKKLDGALLEKPGSVAVIDTFLLHTDKVTDSKIREERNKIVMDALKSAADATGQLQFDNKRNFEILMKNRRMDLSPEEQQEFRRSFEK